VFHDRPKHRNVQFDRRRRDLRLCYRSFSVTRQHEHMFA
jgi:hypothetical protein